MTKLSISDLKAKTGVGFGTSGLRDTVTKLTSQVVYTYTTAFLVYARHKGDFINHRQVALAGDLRQSTPGLTTIVAKAILDQGLEVVNCGLIPTPALVTYALSHQIPSIMVTGSHIPADRNGIKFNLSSGEILKADESTINSLEVDIDESKIGLDLKLPPVISEACDQYLNRYLNFFPKLMLKGQKIGLYGHTAVGRDLYVEILERLGAEVVKLEYSDIFVPLDTEIIDEQLMTKVKRWQQDFALDCVVSTDGDGDRPFLTDERGNIIRNDVLPIIVAKYLHADAVACTVNCNSAVTTSGYFKKVVYTKIGSPHIITAMSELVTQGYRRVIGYEGNGGILTAQTINKEGRQLPALPTRDAILSILSLLACALESGQTISQLFCALPSRSTVFSSLKDIPTTQSLAIIDNWEIYRSDLESVFGPIVSVNLLDGLRLTFKNGDIVHFRPSQNSPEFRDYVESDTFQKAKVLSDQALNFIKKWTS